MRYMQQLTFRLHIILFIDFHLGNFSAVHMYALNLLKLFIYVQCEFLNENDFCI